jgi:hypothetical protein
MSKCPSASWSEPGGPSGNPRGAEHPRCRRAEKAHWRGTAVHGATSGGRPFEIHGARWTGPRWSGTARRVARPGARQSLRGDHRAGPRRIRTASTALSAARSSDGSGTESQAGWRTWLPKIARGPAGEPRDISHVSARLEAYPAESDSRGRGTPTAGRWRVEMEPAIARSRSRRSWP